LSTDGLVVNGIIFPASKGSFSVEGSTLIAEVQCSDPVNTVLGHPWRTRLPRLYTEEFQIGSQSLFLGKIEIIDKELDQAPQFALYMFEHEDVVACEGELRREGDGYRLELSGTAEVMGDPFPFTLSAAVAQEV
jgi:hypothetical protein